MNKSNDIISNNPPTTNEYKPTITDEGKEYNKLWKEIGNTIELGHADINNTKEHNEVSLLNNSNPFFDNTWGSSSIKNDVSKVNEQHQNSLRTQSTTSMKSNSSKSVNNDMNYGFIMTQKKNNYPFDFENNNNNNGTNSHNNFSKNRNVMNIAIPSDSDGEDDDKQEQLYDEVPIICPFTLTQYSHSTNHNNNNNNIINYSFSSTCESIRRSNELYHSHNSISNPMHNSTNVINNNNEQSQYNYRTPNNLIKPNPFSFQYNQPQQSVPVYQSYTPTGPAAFYYDMNAFSYNNHPLSQSQQQQPHKKSINLRMSEKKKSSTTKALNSNGGETGEIDYTINVEHIILGIDDRTTVMIRNVPVKYTSQGLIAEFEGKFKKKFDLFYLPLDYTNESNLGYAFINFIDPLYIVQFFHCYKGWKWIKYDSNKVCDLSYAKYQGKDKLITHLKKKSLEKAGEEKKAIIFQIKKPYPKISIPLQHKELIMNYCLNPLKGIEFIP